MLRVARLIRAATYVRCRNGKSSAEPCPLIVLR
jgi:hypothetical protein